MREAEDVVVPLLREGDLWLRPVPQAQAGMPATPTMAHKGINGTNRRWCFESYLASFPWRTRP